MDILELITRTLYAATVDFPDKWDEETVATQAAYRRKAQAILNALRAQGVLPQEEAEAEAPRWDVPPPLPEMERARPRRSRPGPAD